MSDAGPPITGPSAAPAPAAGTPEISGKRRLRGLVLYTVGALLLGAAVWTVARQGEAVQTAWDSAREASPALVALLLFLPLVNCLVSAVVFWVLTTRYGRVGFWEMAALIASAWLLNNLPMRPGLVGRVAYHRAVNGIRVADSIRVLVSAAGCTAAAACITLLVALAAGLGGVDGAPLLALGATPILLAAALIPAMRAGRLGPLGAGLAWRLAAATALRYTDVLVWSLRYWLVFRLVGSPITPVGAAVIAAAGQAAMLAPVQLGVREWMVGLASSLLPPGLWTRAAAGGAGVGRVGGAGGGAGVGVAPGLMADLVNRAAEIVVALPVGLIAGAWLATRRREAAASAPTGA